MIDRRPAPLPWQAEIALRMRRLWWLKAAGVTAFTWVFFVAYFHLLRHPAHPVTVMPLTGFDRLITFQPLALYAYLSLWFYVGIAPGLQRGFVELVVYGLWMAALCLTALGCFYFWPTAVPPLAVPADVSGVPGFALLQGVDAAGNACPSLHVAAAVFAAIRIAELLARVGVPVGWQLLNAVWIAAIVYSTLAIKQHVVLDALAGGVLGVTFALASLRWRPARGGARISSSATERGEPER